MQDRAELSEQAVTQGLEAISSLGKDLIKENRRIRRWKIFRRLLFLLILAAIFILPYFMKDKLSGVVGGMKPHAAVISMEGLVMPGAELMQTISLVAYRRRLERNNPKPFYCKSTALVEARFRQSVFIMKSCA